MSSVQLFEQDICQYIASSLEPTSNLLDDDWTFRGCQLLEGSHTLQVELAAANDENLVVPIHIAARDVPRQDPVGAGRGRETLVLELLSTFSHQVTPSQVKKVPVRLPLDWSPLT